MSKKEHIMKYGGIKFVINVSEAEINRFIANLPEEKRESLAEVTQELKKAGFIDLLPGHYSTIDKNLEDEQESHPEMSSDPYA